MEVNITDFFNNAEAFNFSASAMEMGQNAGKITWANAQAEAAASPMLTTDDQLQALRDHVQAMGFGKEVQTYDADKCNALFVQLVSGDMREIEALCMGDNGEIDWTEVERLQQRGTIPSNIFGANGGDIYYTLDS